MRMRDELVARQPTPDELSMLLEFVASWEPSVQRHAPLAWLWRVARGVDCPEIALCNAIKPSHLRPRHPRSSRLAHADRRGDYMDRLCEDDGYVARQLALGAEDDPRRTADPRGARDV